MDDGNQTLIILWVLSWCAMILMVLRLGLRKYRHQRFSPDDYMTMGAMVCLMARLGMIHVVLIWGSNNLTAAQRAIPMTAEKIHQLTVGSVLTVVNRMFYNTYIWLQKCVVMLLIQRVLTGLSWEKLVFKSYWVILATSYVVVQVVTWSECTPLKLYWQVLPDPGGCEKAVVQLVVLAALNIATDIMLIALPMPALWRVQRSVPVRLRIMGIFSIGFFLVAITIVRLPINYTESAQVSRTTWASAEAFAAAFVANAPTLYTLRRNRRNNNYASAGSSRGYPSEHFSKSRASRAIPIRDGITVTHSIEMCDTPTTRMPSDEIHDEVWNKEGSVEDLVTKGIVTNVTNDSKV